MAEAISTRVPKELEEGVEEFMHAEKLEKSAAVRKLLWTGLQEWKQRRALELLERGEVTFTKAAEIANLDVWSFASLVRRSGITWIKLVENVRADIKAATE
jgi:predicted HTH domain antitoxin